MKRFEDAASVAFGVAFLALAFAVALETSLRKLLNVSLQGVDELGGYVLAAGAALAFSVALVSRAHIRIDLLHDRMPRAARIALNVAAGLTLLASAGAVAWMAWIALSESSLFNATAQTPWATPLVYPQAAWLLALLLFAGLAFAELVRLFARVFRRAWDAADRVWGPRGSKEELEEELEDLRARAALGGPAETGPRS